jgi:hypothetical protein
MIVKGCPSATTNWIEPMRLTLRTLLAYLDDILEPNQAKEIGTKVSQSTFATGLTNRIREVMRRRRLTVPDTDGPNSGVDPNTVAEYLDNTLPSEAVADVEKVFLESDVNLAEVAASHQILTLVLGEPVDIPQESRERMYVLGPVTRKKSVSSEAAPAANQEATSGATNEVGNEPSKTVIPAYLLPTPMWRRAMPYTIAGLVAVIWFGLIVYDPTFNIFSGSSSDAVSNGTDNTDGLVAANDTNTSDAGNDSGLPPIDTRKRDDLTDTPETSPTGPPPSDAGIDPKPPADAPGVNDKQPPVKVDDAKPPVPMPPAKGKQPPVVAKVDPPEKKPKPEIPVVVGPTVRYVSTKGILLRYDKTADDWFVLPENSVVPPGVRIAIPQPFSAEFEVGGNLCRVEVFGGTSLQFVPPTQNAALALEIERGRILLHREAQAGDPLLVGIGVKGEAWQLGLVDLKTTCGIEIIPRQPNRLDQEMGANWYTGGVYVIGGSARFADGKGLQADLKIRQQIPLTPEHRTALADPASGFSPPTSDFPAWLDSTFEAGTTTRMRTQTLFAKEFDAEQPLSDNIPPVVKHEEPSLSELAVQCLAVTGQHAELVRALRHPDHEESRLASIIGLRTWLAMMPGRGPLLKKDLEAILSSEQDIETIYQLLWGYTPQDAQDPRKSQRLVAWLEHDLVAVRQLAFFHIQKLTGQDYDYLPHNPSAQRFAAIRRWQRHLEREGALIKP